MTQSTSSLSAGTDSHLRLISLPGIAGLAHVQRPVVSMWRKRPLRDLPFPGPVLRERGQEWFDAVSVVEWLEKSGRGNNQDVRADVAAFCGPGQAAPSASPTGPSSDLQRLSEVEFDALTAAVCMIAGSTRPLGVMTQPELLDLADELDPDDEYLFSEIESAGKNASDLARYADQLVDATYNAPNAFEELMSQRFRRHLGHLSQTALTAKALNLIAAMAHTLADQVGFHAPEFVDPTAGSRDLTLAIHRYSADRPIELLHCALDNSATSRLARRRLSVHGIRYRALLADSEGGFLIPAASVAVGHFQSPSSTGPTSGDEVAHILRDIDNLILQSPDTSRALLLGPADAFTDMLPDKDSQRLRDAILRSNRVRAIIRLPAGAITAHPRQRLAIYCLGPVPQGEASQDSMVCCADLADVRLDATTADLLLTELTAAMAGAHLVRRHRMRFLRPVSHTMLLARTGDLVGIGEHPVRPDLQFPADLVVQWEQLVSLAAADIPGPRLPSMTPSSPGLETPAGAPSLGAAAARGEIKMIKGHRISMQLVADGSGVRVLGVPELHTNRVERRVDRLELQRRYPRHTLTEPGDVIFCATPRPMALVDVTGFSLVEYPAKALRLRLSETGPPGSGLTAELLAADISRLPANAKTWRAWPLRRVPHDVEPVLGSALAELRNARSLLHARLDQLDELTEFLTRAATSGDVTLAPPEGTT